MSNERALLQSDIVDSTRIAGRLGDAAVSDLWTSHDRLARDLMRAWHGREIDKSDGFLILFAGVEDAVGYANAYHQAIATLQIPLTSRVGIHFGRVALRANAEVDVAVGAKPIEVEGIAKPICARVMSIARGGQTLLTSDAVAMLDTTRESVRTLGLWRLKGVHEPLELFEVAIGAASHQPQIESPKAYRVARAGDLLLPVNSVPHSLPSERDVFIGRGDILRELADRFESGARLVSVVGTGGIGKTRLAQRFAWASLGDFPGGNWFCDLSQAKSLDGVVFAIAKSLDIPLGDGDPLDQLGNVFSGRGECLIVLDNFEQVTRFAETTIGSWLSRSAHARFLVTTRETLGLPGEVLVALPPLGEADAMSLFLERAAAATSDFNLGAEERSAAKTLVQLLDGLPLAIELAAARVRVMSPRLLLERMNDRFKLLVARSGRPERQATLKAAIDWSWDLLATVEKSALAQLSAFEGGFTLESAESVLGASVGDEAVWMPDLLQSLLEKSLIRRLDGDRFDLSLTLREYAADQLATPGRFPGSGTAAVVAAWSRHWRFFSGLDEREAIAGCGIEADNLVIACQRAAQSGDSGAAANALVAAWAVLALRGPYRLGEELSGRVLRIPSITAEAEAAALAVEGSARFMLGLTSEALLSFSRGLATSSSLHDVRTQARLLCGRGEVLTRLGRMDEATADLALAATLASSSNDASLICKTLNALQALAIEQGQVPLARLHCERAIAVAREAGDRRWEGGLTGNLALLEYSEGRLDHAVALYKQSLLLARESGDRRWEGNGYCNLGLLLQEQGALADAQASLERALFTARELGHKRLEATTLCNLGLVREALGQREEARVAFEFATEIADFLGDKRSGGQFRSHLGSLLARLGHDSLAIDCFDHAQSLLVSINDQGSLAALLCARAEAAFRLENRADAVTALNRAREIADALSAEPTSELHRRLEALSRLGIYSARETTD